MLTESYLALGTYQKYSLLTLALLPIICCPTLAFTDMTVAPSGNGTVFGKHNIVQYLIYPENGPHTYDLRHDIEILFSSQRVQVFRNYRSAIRFWLIEMTFLEYSELRRRHPDVSC